MHTAKQTLTLLRRHPILWLPQFIVAVANLLLNTASSEFARHIVRAVHAGRIPFLTEHYTIRTPDALMASDAATVPVVYLSRFLQYFLILAALTAIALLVHNSARKDLRSQLTHRRSVILNAALLVTGLNLLDLTSNVFLAAAFSYIPLLRPAPAWLLIVLQWTSFSAIVIAFYWVAVPWTLRLALPDLHTALTAQQKNAARWGAALARILWDVFEYGWGRVEGHFLPPRVDPGPFWRAPIILGHPVFLYFLLTFASAAAAVIAQPRRKMPVSSPRYHQP